MAGRPELNNAELKRPELLLMVQGILTVTQPKGTPKRTPLAAVEPLRVNTQKEQAGTSRAYLPRLVTAATTAEFGDFPQS
jgi:hypothetical protein